MLAEKVSYYLSVLGAARAEEARRSTREYAMLTLSAGDHAARGIYPPPGCVQVGIVNNEDNSPKLFFLISSLWSLLFNYHICVRHNISAKFKLTILPKKNGYTFHHQISLSVG